MKTHYDLLGVRPDADDEALRKAYHNAAKAHHPDLNAGDPDATRRFGQIATAMEILRNPERRAAYDRSLDRERQRRRLWRARIAIVVANAIGAAVLIVVLARGHALVGPAFSPSSISTSRMVSRVENRAVPGPVAEENEQRTLATDPTEGDEPGGGLERGVTVSAVSKLSAEAEREAALGGEQDERRQAAERERPTAEREAPPGREDERRQAAGRERPKAERQAAPRRKQDERRPERKARQLAAAAEAAKSDTPTRPQPVQGAQAASSAASPRSLAPVEIAAARAFTRF